MNDYFKNGIAQFNRGSYFEAHVEWEEVWKALPVSPKKRFIQGMIKIAAALYKYKSDELPGMEKLLEKGVALLIENRAAASRLDVGMFLSALQTFYNKYLTGPDKVAGRDLPRIIDIG